MNINNRDSSHVWPAPVSTLRKSQSDEACKCLESSMTTVDVKKPPCNSAVICVKKGGGSLPLTAGCAVGGGSTKLAAVTSSARLGIGRGADGSISSRITAVSQ